MGGKLPTCGNLVVSCAQISTFNLATRSTLKLVSKMWKVWNICCTTGPLKVWSLVCDNFSRSRIEESVSLTRGQGVRNATDDHQSTNCNLEDIKSRRKSSVHNHADGRNNYQVEWCVQRSRELCVCQFLGFTTKKMQWWLWSSLINPMRILSHSKSKSSLQALESLDREESGEKSSKKISRGAWKKTSAPTLLEDEFPNLTLMEVRQFLKLSRENYFKQTSDESHTHDWCTQGSNFYLKFCRNFVILKMFHLSQSRYLLCLRLWDQIKTFLAVFTQLLQDANTSKLFRRHSMLSQSSVKRLFKWKQRFVIYCKTVQKVEFSLLNSLNLLRSGPEASSRRVSDSQEITGSMFSFSTSDEGNL